MLYEAGDETLHVVDYKTDQVTESDIVTSARKYRAQGAVYAEAVEVVTGRRVDRVRFVFAASGTHTSQGSTI